jgi:hypothetical protein
MASEREIQGFKLHLAIDKKGISLRQNLPQQILMIVKWLICYIGAYQKILCRCW